LIIWALLIFWLSSISTIPSIKSPISIDKVAHFGIFFIFCWFSHRAFHFQKGIFWLKKQALLFAFLITCVYAYLDEFHQKFVPGRSYDLYDLLADVIGAFAFIVLFKLTEKRRGEKRDDKLFSLK
jgi:VanZ family protein